MRVVVAVVFLLAGCGASAHTAPAQETAARFESALERNDAAAACALLAEQANRRITTLRPEGCAQALPVLRLPIAQPATTDVWGDTAQVRTGSDTLFLRRFADGWRVLAAGCTSRGEAPYQCVVDGT